MKFNFFYRSKWDFGNKWYFGCVFIAPEEANDILETIRNLFFIFEKKSIRIYIIRQNLGIILICYFLGFPLKILSCDFFLMGWKYIFWIKNFFIFYFFTTAHFWCNGHSTSINASGVWRPRVGVQVSKREFHTYIYLDYVSVEFIYCIKKYYFFLVLLVKISLILYLFINMIEFKHMTCAS